MSSANSKRRARNIAIGLVLIGLVVIARVWLFREEEPDLFDFSSAVVIEDSQERPSDSEVAEGKRLFKEEGRLSCHSLYGQGGNVGPDLAYVGRRREMRWITEHIKDPQRVKPGTIMPQFGFVDEEARAIAAFLLQQAERAASPDLYRSVEFRRRPTAVERGAVAFQKYGCGLCHGIEGTGGVRNLNAHTGDEITSLIYVSRAFTSRALEEKILSGVLTIPKANPDGPDPLLFMPSFKNIIPEEELDDLMTYLMNLAPKIESEE